MMQKERNRENDPRVHFDHNPVDRLRTLPMAASRDSRGPDMVFQPETSTDDGGLPRAMRDGLEQAKEFQLPKWLTRMRPVPWTSAEVCQKNVQRGRNCCLFSPLSYCKDLDVVNGFCVFHLRAIFNLVYSEDALYQVNSRGEAVVWWRSQCFVADPRPIDDRITAVFPVFELFEDAPNVEDIRLYNLERYLVSINMPNWERVYSLHVNFLHRLVTLHTNLVTEDRALSREDQQFDSQLIMHWNLWNEYYSWLLVKYPAQLNLFYVTGQDSMKAIPMYAATTITQMIVRLFSESGTRLDDRRFYCMPATYGLFVRGHIAYIDNLCSSGTTTTESGTKTIGALATLPVLRTDACPSKLLHYEKGVNCQESFCLNAKVNHDAGGLNRAVIVSGSDASARMAATSY